MLFVSFFGLITTSAFAQKGEGDFYVFDENFKPVASIDVATYFLNVRKMADSVFVCRYYQKFGPMVRQETYKDKEFKIQHGRFVWYNTFGKVDSTGFYENGMKDGEFQHYDDTLGTSDIYKYADGKLLSHEDMRKHFLYYTDGRVEDLNPKLNEKDTSKVFTVVQVESEFKGKEKAWSKFISKNFVIPKRYETIVGRKGGRGKTTSYFMVNKVGEVEDIWIARSCEWSVDMEVIRVYSIAPNWTPAIQNGKIVRSRKRQDISFVVDPY